jgi:heme A synthase
MHMPLAFLSLSLLCLHFSLVFDITNPGWTHFITGYVLISLLLCLSVLGFVATKTKIPTRKYLTLAHQLCVVLLLAAFLVHLILKY